MSRRRGVLIQWTVLVQVILKGRGGVSEKDTVTVSFFNFFSLQMKNEMFRMSDYSPEYIAVSPLNKHQEKLTTGCATVTLVTECNNIHL